MRALFHRRKGEGKKTAAQSQPDHILADTPVARRLPEETDNSAALLEACSAGDLRQVQKLSNSVDVLTRNRVGSTPLHMAAAGGHMEIVQYLVEHAGARINTKNRNGHTPAHVARLCDHRDVVQYLHIQSKKAPTDSTTLQFRDSSYGTHDDETSFTSASSRADNPHAVVSQMDKKLSVAEYREAFSKQKSLTLSARRSFHQLRMKQMADKSTASTSSSESPNAPDALDPDNIALATSLQRDRQGDNALEQSSSFDNNNNKPGFNHSHQEDGPKTVKTKVSSTEGKVAKHAKKKKEKKGVKSKTKRARTQLDQAPSSPRSDDLSFDDSFIDNQQASMQKQSPTESPTHAQAQNRLSAGDALDHTDLKLPPGVVVGVLLDDSTTSTGKTAKSLEKAPSLSFPLHPQRNQVASTYIDVEANVVNHSDTHLGRMDNFSDGVSRSDEHVSVNPDPDPTLSADKSFLQHASRDQREEIEVILLTTHAGFFLAFRRKLYEIMSFCATLALSMDDKVEFGRSSFVESLLKDSCRAPASPAEIAADPIASLFACLAERSELRRYAELYRLVDAAAFLSSEDGDVSLQRYVLRLAIYACRAREQALYSSNSLPLKIMRNESQAVFARKKRFSTFRRLSQSLYESMDENHSYITQELSQCDRWAKEEGYVFADIAIDISMKETQILDIDGNYQNDLIDQWATSLIGLDSMESLYHLPRISLIHKSIHGMAPKESKLKSRGTGIRPERQQIYSTDGGKSGSDMFKRETKTSKNDLVVIYSEDEISLSEQDKDEFSVEMSALIAEQRMAISRIQSNLVRTASVSTLSIQDKRLCEPKRRALTKLWNMHEPQVQETIALLAIGGKKEKHATGRGQPETGKPLFQMTQEALKNLWLEYERADATSS